MSALCAYLWETVLCLLLPETRPNSVQMLLRHTVANLHFVVGLVHAPQATAVNSLQFGWRLAEHGQEFMQKQSDTALLCDNILSQLLYTGPDYTACIHT